MRTQSIALLALASLAWSTSACTTRQGDFTVISSKLVRLSDFDLSAADRVKNVEGRDVAHIIVLFPTKEEVYLPALDRPTPDVTGPFARALSARGIPYIDLLAAFRPRAAEGETLFLQVDIHPNEAGYALVADEVLKRLRSGAGRREAPAAGATRDGDALYANRANGFRQEPSGPR